MWGSTGKGVRENTDSIIRCVTSPDSSFAMSSPSAMFRPSIKTAPLNRRLNKLIIDTTNECLVFGSQIPYIKPVFSACNDIKMLKDTWTWDFALTAFQSGDLTVIRFKVMRPGLRSKLLVLPLFQVLGTIAIPGMVPKKEATG